MVISIGISTYWTDIDILKNERYANADILWIPTLDNCLTA